MIHFERDVYKCTVHDITYQSTECPLCYSRKLIKMVKEAKEKTNNSTLRFGDNY